MVLILLTILLAHTLLVEAALTDTVKNKYDSLKGKISGGWGKVAGLFTPEFFINVFIIAFVLYLAYRYLIGKFIRGNTTPSDTDNTFAYIVIVGLAIFIAYQIGGGVYFWKHPSLVKYVEKHFLVNAVVLAAAGLFIIRLLAMWSTQARTLNDDHNRNLTTVVIIILALVVAANLQGLLASTGTTGTPPPPPPTAGKYIWEMDWFTTGKTYLLGDSKTWKMYGKEVNGVTVYCANDDGTDCAVLRPPHLWVLIGASLLYYFSFNSFIGSNQRGGLGSTAWWMISIYLAILAAQSGLRFETLITFGYYILILILYRAVRAGSNDNAPLAGAIAYGIVNTLANTAFKSLDAAPGITKIFFGGSFIGNAIAGFIVMYLASRGPQQRAGWVNRTLGWISGIPRRLMRGGGQAGPQPPSAAAAAAAAQQQQLQQNMQGNIAALQALANTMGQPIQIGSTIVINPQAQPPPQPPPAQPPLPVPTPGGSGGQGTAGGTGP